MVPKSIWKLKQQLKCTHVFLLEYKTRLIHVKKKKNNIAKAHIWVKAFHKMKLVRLQNMNQYITSIYVHAFSRRFYTKRLQIRNKSNSSKSQE